LGVVSRGGVTVEPTVESVEAVPPLPKLQTVCPKCGKPSWAPYRMRVVKKLASKVIGGRPVDQVYEYDVYRHPHKSRKNPRKHTVKAV